MKLQLKHYNILKNCTFKYVLNTNTFRCKWDAMGRPSQYFTTGFPVPDVVTPSTCGCGGLVCCQILSLLLDLLTCEVVSFNLWRISFSSLLKLHFFISPKKRKLHFFCGYCNRGCNCSLYWMNFILIKKEFI